MEESIAWLRCKNKYIFHILQYTIYISLFDILVCVLIHEASNLPEDSFRVMKEEVKTDVCFKYLSFTKKQS